MPERGRSSMGRTATGAGIIGGASSARIQSYVDVIIDQIFLPLLYSFLHMDRRLLDPKDIRTLVGKTLWEAMEADHDGDLIIDMCNSSDLKFTMSAGTSIAARQKMAASLPLQMQMFSQPAFQQGITDAGMKVNWLEIGRRDEQATGWKSQEDIFIPITQEDIQRKAQSNPEIVKAKTTSARIAQLHQQNKDLSSQEHGQKLAEIDAKGLAGLGDKIIDREIERQGEKAEGDQIEGSF
jgi:hypothetical protein